jgi:hypothetical protein
MNIEQYPKEGYFIMVSSAKTELGNYDFVNDGDLSIANLRVYHRNPNPFSYQLRLVLSGNVLGEAVCASDWEVFSDTVINQTGEFWLGDLTFKFNDYPVNAQDSYFIRLETQNYTRLNDDRYLGVWVDWLQPVGVTNTGAARIALGVKR